VIISRRIKYVENVACTEGIRTAERGMAVKHGKGIL
jgi:hypothetical protein